MATRPIVDGWKNEIARSFKNRKKKTMRKQMYGPMTKYVVRPTRKEYDLG